MEFVFISDKADNWEDAIVKTSRALFDAGFVTEEFGSQCIKREREYPTGLGTQIPIAIPHTDSAFVHTSAICVLALESQVPFINMEDSESEVPVEYVLNLAIKDGKNQVTILNKVLQVFNREGLPEQLERKGNGYLKELIMQAFVNAPTTAKEAD
ncbi:putative Phosphoenolpyruvate-dependent sugar phosphotransferase system, EIIA 2 [uncultured Eubacteriales bacterium]|uniref:Putative Phosphoenolpyruvate-dependent sugar phosphotransferase system, EIIA 2 n=1 Tax=uncultured Eubacteriales bacterium TaxID=172733 RepID=A0A212JCK7_9FIRM|nr:putative Phosphoenolpyruvate-dependent sugar phosphotransferase system, EIIA 2 [uncultured Eubacteriales bacterium]